MKKSIQSPEPSILDCLKFGLQEIYDSGCIPERIRLNPKTLKEAQEAHKDLTGVSLRYMGINIVADGDIEPGKFFIQTKPTHGGARPGAGRPENPVKKLLYGYRLTPDENTKVKAYIQVMRMPIPRDLPPSGALKEWKPDDTTKNTQKL